MHRSQLGGIVIDCNESVDLQEAARFWSQALGYTVRQRPDLDASRYVDLEAPPDEVHVTLQRVTHASRCHLDLETDDHEGETARLVALGARVIARQDSWITLEAPTGHRFCIVKVGRRNFHEQASCWHGAAEARS
jgi:hypothetical protein